MVSIYKISYSLSCVEPSVKWLKWGLDFFPLQNKTLAQGQFFHSSSLPLVSSVVNYFSPVPVKVFKLNPEVCSSWGWGQLRSVNTMNICHIKEFVLERELYIYIYIYFSRSSNINFKLQPVEGSVEMYQQWDLYCIYLSLKHRVLNNLHNSVNQGW